MLEIWFQFLVLESKMKKESKKFISLYIANLHRKVEVESEGCEQSSLEVVNKTK